MRRKLPIHVAGKGQLTRLKDRRTTIAHELARLDAAISGLEKPLPKSRSLSAESLEQALDTLAGDMPPLPPDFSRADLYEDHD